MIVINFRIPNWRIWDFEMRLARTCSSGTVENSVSWYSAMSCARGMSKHKPVICPIFGASPNSGSPSQSEIATADSQPPEDRAWIF